MGFGNQNQFLYLFLATETPHSQTPHSLKKKKGGKLWRLEGCFETNSTECSSRGPKFDSSNPHLSTAIVPGYSVPSSDLGRYQTNTMQAYMKEKHSYI